MGYHVGADYKMSDVDLIRLNEKAAILTYKIQYEVIFQRDRQGGGKQNIRFTTWVHRGGGWLILGEKTFRGSLPGFTECYWATPESVLREVGEAGFELLSYCGAEGLPEGCGR
jgi:hypothetical protein